MSPPFIVMPNAAVSYPIQLGNLDKAYLGRPFCAGSIDTLSLNTMDVVYLGQPFIIFIGT